MNTPVVSVLIPAYNAASYIEQTLDSVLKQTWPLVEIIVVDDGSTDDTLATALRYASERVHVVSQVNAGAGAARNRAFELATGEYIQYLDADDLLHPDKIRAQLHCLQVQPSTVLSSSVWSRFLHTPAEQAPEPSVLWRDYSDPAQWLVDAWETGVWMQPSAWLTPRHLIEAAGPWNEQISLHDDGEFFSRVLLKSTGVVFCADAQSYYRRGVSNSLSSIRNEKATWSHLAVCEAYEQNLLAYRNTPETRRACANNYQRLIYEYYPAYRDIQRVASARVKALGGATAVPMVTPLFRLLNSLVGWRTSKRLQNYIYKHRLNPASWYA